MLIKGVKYACERCIRGHRVTTCNHTNEPLTMIKPKGRPSTQCHHCRENRKSKNLHVSCTCGKKGKNGTHLPSCACHKTNHCTCSNSQSKKSSAKGDIHHMTPSEKAKKKSLIDAANADLKKKSDSESITQSNPSDSSPGSVTSPGKKQPTPQLQTKAPLSLPDQSLNTTAYNTLLNQNFVIEDIVLPFNTNKSGLFDLFSSNLPTEVGGNDSLVSLNNLASSSSTPINVNGGTSSVPPANGKISKKDPPIPLSPSEADVDHMFPLFPLVGTQSFDNENQPLLAVKQPQQPTPMRPNFNSINEITSSSYSSIPSAMENASSSQYQLRPKRPESVLSIASNSSTRSFDFFGNTHNNHNSSFLNGSLPTSSTSAAYPPSNGLDESNLTNNSQDDHSMQHHFGRSGLGSNKFGSQLSKIESEMYTDNFFDDPYGSQLENNEPPELSVSSSVNNLYNVPEATYGSGTFNLINDYSVPVMNGDCNGNSNSNGKSINNVMTNDADNILNGNFSNDVYNNNMNMAALGLSNPFATGLTPNLYEVQDIINESPFDYFIPNNLQTNNNNNQENGKKV